MTKQHLDQLNTLIASAFSGRFPGAELECKHFFHGAALYANGRICLSLTPAGFALKLPEESRNALLKRKGVKKLRYFPKSPIKKDYVVLPGSMLNDMNTLRGWIRASINFVLEQPTE